MENLQVGIGGNICELCGLAFFSVNLALCLHFDMISSLVLSVWIGSENKIAIFSVKHRSHFLLPEEKAWALLWMDQWTSGSSPPFFYFSCNITNGRVGKVSWKAYNLWAKLFRKSLGSDIELLRSLGSMDWA